MHPGSLGDVLLALPAMRALRAAFSDHALGLLTQYEVGRFLLASAEVHKIFALEGVSLTNILSGTGVMDEELGQWLSNCDVAVGWMADADGRVGSAFHAFGIPHILIASPHLPGHRLVHQTDRFLDTIAAVISKSSQDHAVQLPFDAMTEAASRLRSSGILASQLLVIVHPGSGSRNKCAAPGLFANLLREYERNGIAALVIGGPADDDQVASLQRAYSHPFRLLQGLDLFSIAGVIAHANCFIGHDSGLTHLAACLHVPTVALFGPTDPHRWAPRGPHVKVVAGPSCHCQGEEAVRACVDKPCLQIPSEEILSACSTMVRAE